MVSDTKKLLTFLTSTSENIDRIREIENSIASMSVISAQNYDSLGGGSGYSGLSMVERYVEKMILLKDELGRCKARLELVEHIKSEKILTDGEYKLLEWIQLGGKLSQYALNNHIYKSAVYKIRDNALEKMMKFVQSDAKCKNLWLKC